MTYDAFRESERKGWDSRATGYGEATARATLQSIPPLLPRAGLFPGARVLDAGCGPGYVAGCAQILGAQAQGVDFAPAMVTRAQAQFPHIPFQQADVEALPFDADSFDAVLSNIVLFHVTNPGQAMAEAARILVPGGAFVFSQWLGPDKSPCYKMIFDVLSAHADMSLADPAPNAYVLSDQDAVTQMLADAGFTDVQFDVVENALHVEGDSFYDFFMQFGVRVPLILERQSTEVREAVRRDMDTRAGVFRAGGRFVVPMPSLIVSARLA